MGDEQKQLVSDFKATFINFEAGVRVLNYLSRHCCEYQQTYDIQSERQSCFNEGARWVMLEIRRKLNTNIDEVKQTETINEME